MSMELTYGSVCSGIEAAASKACAKCGVEKPLADFHKQPGGPMGRHSYCKACASVYYRGRKRVTAPEKRRDLNFKERYGLSAEDVIHKIKEQGGKCAICGKELVDSSRPCVDHDHDSKQVRGILCHACNIALHHIEDVEYRTKALDYLRRHGCAS